MSSASIEKIVDDKYYEGVLVRYSIYCKNILNALKIVRKFIIRKERILTGGMAIDYALKMKNPTGGIYDDDTIPDYDFFSPTHFQDAYDLAQWLNRLGYTNISVINAAHPTTMKVRINFITVADITYIPPDIFCKIPTLNYQNIRIVHPHYQFIDQHRSLSFPHEYVEFDLVLPRTKKDMVRHDKLYAQYPFYKSKQPIIEYENYSIQLPQNICLAGISALYYWFGIAEELGFNYKDDNTSRGKYDYINLQEKGILNIKLPKGIPIELYSHDAFDSQFPWSISKQKKEIFSINKKHKITKDKVYSRYLDIFPMYINYNITDTNTGATATKTSKSAAATAKTSKSAAATAKTSKSAAAAKTSKSAAAAAKTSKSAAAAAKTSKSAAAEENTGNIRIYNNETYLAAHLQPGKYEIYVVNLQVICVGLLWNIVQSEGVDEVKDKNKCKGSKNNAIHRTLEYKYYYSNLYIKVRNLIKWASDLYYKTDNKKTRKILEQFFPTTEYYGNRNVNETIRFTKIKNLYKNKQISADTYFYYKQPKHVYDSDLKYHKVPRSYYTFKYETSRVFDISGMPLDN
jgi:hypothetical protein